MRDWSLVTFYRGWKNKPNTMSNETDQSEDEQDTMNSLNESKEPTANVQKAISNVIHDLAYGASTSITRQKVVILS